LQRSVERKRGWDFRKNVRDRSKGTLRRKGAVEGREMRNLVLDS
jgi:hypothetical protein